MLKWLECKKNTVTHHIPPFNSNTHYILLNTLGTTYTQTLSLSTSTCICQPNLSIFLNENNFSILLKKSEILNNRRNKNIFLPRVNIIVIILLHPRVLFLQIYSPPVVLYPQRRDAGTQHYIIRVFTQSV